MQAFAHQGISVLLSASRDGEIAAKTASALGYKVLRGSSSRQGASGLRRLLRSIQAQPLSSPCLIGMALDGPRGPRRVAKPGTLWLADTLQIPIYPLGAAMRRGWHLRKSWDQARLPWPLLGKACVVLGRPCCNPDDLLAGMQATELEAERMLHMPKMPS
jgi:lysophospholipid acyltransferase (LPLAT)-like uncharacterized protein